MALTGKTIGDLTFLSEPTSNTLIPVELSGTTYHIAYSAVTSDFGSSGITRFSNTWTVTPGTSDYSFTVDTNNTYKLWVLGNIPNGIITYNATVTITNSNVPVLGSQFAWNYTGAGNPILITSIPAQIIGTSGTISTSNPAVGTSTNTFTFGIQNNTSSNVTVTYGYVKIS